MIRIMLVDDNDSFRRRLARYLGLQDDLQVVGEAANGEQAVELARNLTPDVILMDFRMPRLDGFTAARAIRAEVPDAKIFILTAYPGALDPDRASRGGVQGLLVKDTAPSEIVATIRQAAG